MKFIYSLKVEIKKEKIPEFETFCKLNNITIVKMSETKIKSEYRVHDEYYKLKNIMGSIAHIKYLPFIVKTEESEWKKLIIK